jgi:NhaA family Na+:H+ antiporter
VSWVGFYIGGLHPALALVPVLPFVPCADRDAGLYVEGGGTDPLTRFEHWFSTPVEFVLFFFALANAGVRIGSSGAVTWMVLVALLAGKPLGILAFTWMAELVGLRRADGLHWRALLVVGFAAGIGFTVSLFFATAAFPAGPTMDQAKLGAILSVGAGGLAVAAARALRVS